MGDESEYFLIVTRLPRSVRVVFPFVLEESFYIDELHEVGQFKDRPAQLEIPVAWISILLAEEVKTVFVERGALMDQVVGVFPRPPGRVCKQTTCLPLGQNC